MSLYTVSTGGTINAGDLNQAVNVLQQPSGGTETGTYFLAGWGNANGDLVSIWIPLLSRNATPISASRTVTSGPTSLNSPTTANLYSSGFQIFSDTTGATTNGTAGGAWTVSF